MTNFADNIVRAATRLADGVVNEMALEDNRHNVKMQVIERIMAGENKLTGKPHSFSSAETAAAADPAYTDYLERLRDAARERILAKGAYDAAIVAGRLQEVVADA
jgi:hypothetical protein